MKLYTELIPHKYFHKGIWLSTNSVPWYFFSPQDRQFKIPTNNKFYDTVDEPLLPIVKLLHKNGIPTTPSCSGHFRDIDEYSDIYDSLINAGKRIKKDSVVLKDDENNKKYYYRNKKFILPWDKDEFLDKIGKYQKKGVIGFVDKDKSIFNDLDGGDYNLINNDGNTIIITESNNKKELLDKWKNINNIIRKIL